MDKAPVPTERAIQREILRMCGTVFPAVLVVHVPNGAHLSGTDAQRSRQMGALRGDGLKPGFPDLIALWNGGAGFLEVKRPKTGRVSDDQKAMIGHLSELSHNVAIVRSAIEAQDALLSWGAPANAVRWVG